LCYWQQDFTVQKKDDNALLKWSTAWEQNTSDFVVQQSSNGIAWNDIGVVKATHNSNGLKAYTYSHTNPVTGINYYRILQKDIDGKSSYRYIRSLLFTTHEPAYTIPTNPVVNGSLQIKLNKSSSLSLYNNEG
jgi:hypothetical protein